MMETQKSDKIRLLVLSLFLGAMIGLWRCILYRPFWYC